MPDRQPDRQVGVYVMLDFSGKESVLPTCVPGLCQRFEGCLAIIPCLISPGVKAAVGDRLQA